MIDTGASVVGDLPTVRVSGLYRRGEPLGRLVLKHWCPIGRFEFTVVPNDNSITVATHLWPPLPIGFEEYEFVTEIEWKPWAFESVRPYIVCAKCGEFVVRAFIERQAPVGALCCRRCARVRYTSQARLSAIDRLTERIDSLRAQLGGQPAQGVLTTPVPRKPPRMHWETYDRLIVELYALEEELADAKEEQVANALDKARASIARGHAELERLERLETRLASRARKR